MLVHGTPSRSMLWRDVAPVLATRFAVYVFDLLGYGASERNEGQKVSVRMHGRVLAELVEQWGLCGAGPRRPRHRRGGRAARSYATMPAHIFREVAGAHLRTATCRPMSPEVFAAYFDQWEGSRGQQLWLRNVRGFDEQDTADFEPLLDDLQTPTRVIWGEQDAWLAPELGEKVAKLLPAADHVLIPGAGHFSPEDQPTGVARALIEFLR